MMKKFVIIIAVSSALSSYTATAQNVKITGLGASTCIKYLTDVDSNENAEKIYFAWAQGFMNGALVRAPAGVDDNLNLVPDNFLVIEQMSFLKNWCSSSRGSDFSYASFALFKELRSRMPK